MAPLALCPVTSQSLTRSRQIKQTAGIPRGIWPPPSPTLLFDFFTQNIILFSHLCSSALFSSHLLSQNSLLPQCVVSSALSFLLSYHFFWINLAKPPDLLSCTFTPYFVLLHFISCFVLPENAPMNHITLLVLLGQALPWPLCQSSLAQSCGWRKRRVRERDGVRRRWPRRWHVTASLASHPAHPPLGKLSWCRVTEKVGEDRKVEQHEEKNNNRQANNNKGENKGQMMTEEDEQRCGAYRGM